MSREIKFRAWHTVHQELMEHKSIPVALKNVVDDNVWKYMQYTGLKDKNGVEIYEEDILKDGEGIGIVHYYAPLFGVTTPNGVFALNKGKVNCGDLKETEVIGNTFQNPELINK